MEGSWNSMAQTDECPSYSIWGFPFPFLSRTRRGSELAETAISCGGRDTAKAAPAKSGAQIEHQIFFCYKTNGPRPIREPSRSRHQSGRWV